MKLGGSLSVSVRRPNWIVIDQVFDLVDRSVLKQIPAVFTAELANVRLLYTSLGLVQAVTV